MNRRVVLYGIPVVISLALFSLILLHLRVRHGDTAVHDTNAITSEMDGPNGEAADRGTESERDAFRALITPYANTSDTIPLRIFLDNYDRIGPNAMRAVLGEDRQCHSKGHNLGRAIYAKTNDLAAATAICRSSCSGGCVHGALMAYFEHTSGTAPDPNADHHVTIDDLTPALKRTFAAVCENRAVTDYTGIGNCYHAVGHALATVADYDIPAAISLCDVFAPNGPGAVYYCATGVYMERDIMFGESDAITPNDPLAPCTTGQYPAGCYRYKIARMLRSMDDADSIIQTCTKLRGVQQEACFHGLGFAIGWRAVDNPYMISTVCAHGTEADERMCLEGVFGYTNMYDRTVAARACLSYTGNVAACTAAQPVLNFTMQRDFAPYIARP